MHVYEAKLDGNKRLLDEYETLEPRIEYIIK